MVFPPFFLLFFLSLNLFSAPFVNQAIAQQYNRPVISDGTIYIVAVMAEFVPDDNRFTSGNGTFEIDFLANNDITISPLPHDKAYFESHLQFAQNYFQAASFGKLDIEYIVLPEIIQLPNEMKAYSPTGPDDSENFKLGNLAKDVWTLVAEQNFSGLEHLPQDRTMFIIFHAGVGRDIELTGTTLDKTPQDIPSVFLTQDAIGRLIDEPTFDGFPITENLRVTNTAILPQTQSRRGEDVTGAEFVLELSINGILTANIGSFIGLPDLFNTDSGASGIGRFGLMDGAGIFSYFGLFPPLPSAWERYFMGWSTPFDIDLDSEEPIELEAVSQNGAFSLARHFISSDEFFLVENRHRDPLDEGVTLTIRTPEGTIETVTFDNTEDRFDPFDQRFYDEILPPGVLINVSNFDWSLPGGLDAGEDGQVGTDDDRILNGGMLIWHIDDAVIRSTIDDNAINNNPDRPGIALQEADGAQDIGRPGTTITNFANGGPFDFWWSGNDFTVITPGGGRIVLYKNRFGDDTFPNNRSNSGGRTYFEFYDFSDNIATSTFFARRVLSEDINLIAELDLDGNFFTESNEWPLAISAHNFGDDTIVFVQSSEHLYTIPLDENSQPVSDFISVFDDVTPLQHLVFDNTLYLAFSLSGETIVGSYSLNYSDFSWTESWNTTLPENTQTGIISTLGIDFIDIDGTPFRLNIQDGALTTESTNYQTSGIIGNAQVIIRDDLLEFFPSQFSFVIPGIEKSKKNYGGLTEIEVDQVAVPFLLRDQSLSLFPNDREVEIQNGRLSLPAIVDFDNNNYMDFLFTDYSNNELIGKNRNGGVLWNFPVSAIDGKQFNGTPLIVQDTIDETERIIFTPVTDSLSYTLEAFDSRLRSVDGYPLYLGSLGEFPIDGVPVQPLFFDGRLFTVSPTGEFRIWEFEDPGTILWSNAYGNSAGNKILGLNSGQTPALPMFSILNKDETYNWPNPASTETNIRFETQGEAEIEITVLNMSGSRIYRESTTSRGFGPQETLVSTAGWPNGVYYARVQATQNGSRETKVIKIVVMR